MPTSFASPPPVPPNGGASDTGRAMDALWRALAYCLHPRVILISLLPLLLTMAVLGGLAWWGWSDAVAAMRQGLDTWSLSQTFLGWLDGLGAESFRVVLAPLLVVVLAVPLVLVICLLVVALWMTPAMVRLVAARRFPQLSKLHGGGWWTSLAWSLGSTLVALLALALTLPLWLIPPFALLLPPLIWGWLTYRVLAFDTLADHASPAERRTLLKRHRPALLALGVITGYLGAAPTALWAFSAMTIVLAPLLVVVSIWMYTVVFAFSSLWFTHFLLAALADLRAVPHAEAEEVVATGAGDGPSGALHPAPTRPPDDLVIDVPSRILPNDAPPVSGRPSSPLPPTS